MSKGVKDRPAHRTVRLVYGQLEFDKHDNPIPNPLYEKNFFDKNGQRLVLSHNQSLFHFFDYHDLLTYDPNRPMPNFLYDFDGTHALRALVDLLQYPSPARFVERFGCKRSDWLFLQYWMLENPTGASNIHPVFKHQFLTMESLERVPESFLVMCARDIPPWIMRKMDNWRPYCESGCHNLLNHYLLGWCWFWLQMEVTQRMDRIRAFIVQDEYERIRGKEDKGYERDRVRREMSEEEDPENPFNKYGIKKRDALRDAREVVERLTGIGALWFFDYKGKENFEKHFGDAIPPKRKLSGEGNTKEYCIACNLSVVGGSGEEVFVALAANMFGRAPCAPQDGTEGIPSGWPRLWPLVRMWIHTLGREKWYAAQPKIKKLAQTLFVIRKYLRWRQTPLGKESWLYSDPGSDEYHPRDMKLTPTPTLRMWRDERAVKREWECYVLHKDPHAEEDKEKERERRALPPPARNATIRESFSTKHAVPLSFYNLTNSQVSPAPAPSEVGRDDSTSRNSTSRTSSTPSAVPGTSTSTALVRTRDYPSENFSAEPESDNETLEIDLFDDASTITCNSFTSRTSTRPSTGARPGTSTRTDTNTSSMGRRRTNLSSIDEADDEIENRSSATWSHLSAVPEALNLIRAENARREAALAEKEKEKKKDEGRTKEAALADREQYRHEGSSQVGRSGDSRSDTHRGGSSSSSSSQRHREDKGKEVDRGTELTRQALEMLSVERMKSERSGSSSRRTAEREDERRGGGSYVSSSSYSRKDKGGEDERRRR
ncbi:hypothetical protein B0T20DRAFT_463963 [Sordaria brevicollis]|uniref:Uncharacterized protein n=1 Tax=Sordaria brevicollis TaxID=83679 RepID=A0AAE0U5I6_SORBR|nr:hypothetical protein B0T20DRAFT_463963 [Sordaria brevicollis]